MAGSGTGCLLSEPRLRRFGGGDVAKVIAKGRANELTTMFVSISSLWTLFFSFKDNVSQ